MLTTVIGIDPEAVELEDTLRTFIWVPPPGFDPGLTLTDMNSGPSPLLCFLEGCEADGGPWMGTPASRLREQCILICLLRLNLVVNALPQDSHA